MRLTVVALFGIETTIIALASAASAATQSDGGPAVSSPYEAELRYGPPGSGHPGTNGALSDALGPRNGTLTLQRLMRATGDLQDVQDWQPTYDDGLSWTMQDMRGPQESQKRPPAAQEPPEAYTPQGETQQRSPAPTAAPAKKTDQTRTQEDATRTRKAASKAKSLRSSVRNGVVRIPLGRKQLTIDLNRALPRQAAVRMSHGTATGWLESAGLRTRSTGNCTSKHLHHCTSLDEVRTGTIVRAIELKQQSGCPIMVTGGTEAGHAPGQFSHGNGYKLDIGHNSCIDRYITANHERVGTRSDGAALYRSGSGPTFADESDHWDILFK
ncbi:hypothetical protein ACTWPT_28415 [Nonomuraea sp. 3N208]|uniref:hypothetical protein n=1 Tax=Nonomuraea sp. 3N208 TaxID=3457421 RepID=UPI003FD1EA46